MPKCYFLLFAEAGYAGKQTIFCFTLWQNANIALRGGYLFMQYISCRNFSPWIHLGSCIATFRDQTLNPVLWGELLIDDIFWFQNMNFHENFLLQAPYYTEMIQMKALNEVPTSVKWFKSATFKEKTNMKNLLILLLIISREKDGSIYRAKYIDVKYTEVNRHFVHSKWNDRRKDFI